MATNVLCQNGSTWEWGILEKELRIITDQEKEKWQMAPQEMKMRIDKGHFNMK